MTNRKSECIFDWYIENYSYCLHENGEGFYSPEFTADGLEGAVWKLRLYPRGDRQEEEGYVSLFLCRSKYDKGPAHVSVNFEVFLAGMKLPPKFFLLKTRIMRGTTLERRKLAKMEEILSNKKDTYLPQDTLHVRCVIGRYDKSLQQTTKIVARTRIGIQEISFVHLTESFSKLKPNEMKTVQIGHPLHKHCALRISLHFIEESNEEKIIVEFKPLNEGHKIAKCKICLLDTAGSKIECCEVDNRFDPLIKGIQNMFLSLTRQAILKRKIDYLSEDTLSLFCECVVSSGVEYERIEKAMYDTPFVAFNQINNSDHTKGIYDTAQKPFPSAMDDLRVIFKNQLLTDVELKTKTRSFPAHKLWLCARSPVFKSMLTSDMREKNSSIVPIDDLEDETVQEMLHFLYTDEFEKFCWESAMKLFYAGDKYQIEGLKKVCSSFLVANVCPSSASEVLILADTHSDSELKKAVEDYILRHENQVFRSEEWEKLSELNPQLANKTMLLKYKREIED